jgi:hypothetical protein
VELGFELWTSHLLGRCSIIWAMSPAIFSSVVFEIGSSFGPGWPGPQSYFTLPTVNGGAWRHHSTQLWVLEHDPPMPFSWPQPPWQLGLQAWATGIKFWWLLLTLEQPDCEVCSTRPCLDLDLDYCPSSSFPPFCSLSVSLYCKHSAHRKYFPAVRLGDNQLMHIRRNTHAVPYCPQQISVFTGRAR